MTVRLHRLAFAALFLLHPWQAFAQDSVLDEFQNQIQPFLKKNCESCHSGTEAEAKLDTTVFRDLPSITQSWDSWQAIVSRVHLSEMPPADSDVQPTIIERKLLEAWTTKFRQSEALRQRGDPGPISTRRLSNAEFNYTIRDLTGVDIRPTRTFPVDPANEAGFDNSAESLSISPALVTKYLDAAREVADHLLLTPDGIRFAPHPVVTDTDRDKYCVQRIVDFYQRQPIQYSDYLLACWRLRVEIQHEVNATDLKSYAMQLRLSPKYLATIWETLNHKNKVFGPLAAVKQRWDGLPADITKVEEVKATCKELAEFINEKRARLTPGVSNLKGPGMNGGSQALVMWKNRKMAGNRRLCDVESLTDNPEDSSLEAEDIEAFKAGSEDDRKAIVDSYQKFCSLFPDAFFILERGRAHIDPKEAAKEAKGRLLSAGFHSMTGYFRDDQPLCELVLSDEDGEELDRLWNELEFISHTPTRQFSGFIWFERAESGFINEPTFNFVRAEDRSAASPESLKRFEELYLEKAHDRDASEEVIEAVQYHFADMNRQLRRLEKQLADAEPIQLKSLIEFAQRAFRRPLTEEDRKGIEAFYKLARQQPNADHRSAMEDTLVSILVSPSHLYRWDLQTKATDSQALTDLELANRLSYFLWSSMPDDQLLKSAERNDLVKDATLTTELRRLLNDSRSRGMIVEFVGNWLDFRRFEVHNGVDREQFPSFTDQLRQSMNDEPIEYFRDLIARNGSVMELLRSNHVVVNEDLAKHYNIAQVNWDEPTSSESSPNWKRIENTHEYQRGGLIPMAVFLTQNAPGLRTSPVKRGYWVVRRLLGEHIPPPPPKVPELPTSEKQLGDLTLREILAKHREHTSCAGCHNRFDSIGLMLEGFDPIGRPRTEDLGGRSISTLAKLPNGVDATGLQGLQDYILQNRADDFRRHFCESLLAFALGRSLIIPDDILIDEMLEQLKANDDRILSAFETIVRSPQFKNKRGSNQGKLDDR